MSVKTTISGFPKIGKNRELKKFIEGYWKGELTKDEMFKGLEQVNKERYSYILEGNLDFIPSNDFSLYDFILDISTMLNVIPDRFKHIEDSIDLYFAMARGSKNAIACEMTKWFDTNYHYIVPELTGNFELLKNRPLQSYRWVKENYQKESKPIITGPFTYIYLGKVYEKTENSLILSMVRSFESKKFKYLVLEISKLYNQILKELEKEGVTLVQIDEPAFVLDLSKEDVELINESYKILTEGLEKIDIIVNTYYESLDNFEDLVFNLPVSGFGLDFTVNEENMSYLERFGYPDDKLLFAGVVSGRDPWKTDYNQTLKNIEKITKIVSEDRLVLSNSAPLFHLPVTVESEKGHLDENILNMLSFASERITELKKLKEIINEGKDIPDENLENIRNIYINQSVREKVKTFENEDVKRTDNFKDRYTSQMKELNLPRFPTTTIGSFPQTKEVRQVRAKFRRGEISKEEYEDFIRREIKKAIEIQEKIGLDVLVHGEFERTDMVEFFGEKMEGFAFTKNGWVQSYGTRCVRPPIIYGDVSRPEPMTLNETLYAQSLTKKPVKGMLTGPVTILNWSFYRKDIPKKEIAFQIAVALQDEVLDLEKSGIKVIQIDEPAFREGLPLKKRKQEEYLNWAVKAFRITNYKVKKTTQIHTHMCYSEFNEIIKSIYEMDADVISIEASRSRGDIIEAFENFKYDHGIGIGLYDIHSPRIPTVEEMLEIAERTLKVIDKDLIWINPDCGLKTRGWEETIPSLENMMKVAEILRKKYGESFNW